ncbi:MAG: hypothetical protein HUJ99_03265, partial [Bacteroidaceae bacterium]|nr:hypothetical protein [Bacteroidaceae bacterium]
MCNSHVYVKIGASILLCVVAAFVFLLWPVSDERWKRAAVVLENRYCHAMVCQGDTLYFAAVSSHNGLQGESFRSAPCERSQMGLGYFRWPWGGIVGQSEVMDRPIQMQWLEQNSQLIVEKTLDRVALHQQTMEEVLKEFEYYNSTHMKDDDGWFEMKYLHEQRLQEKARLDSLKVFLEKAKQYKPSWHYIFKLIAYVPDHLEPLPCGNVWELGKSICTSLQGNMPDNSTSLLSLAFDWDDMVIPTDFVPEDTVNRHVGILRLEGGGTYKGMMRGTTPDGVGGMSFADGRKYYGGFEDGNMVGNGEMRHPHGLHMAGEWVEDHLMSGRVAFADGSRYEGSLLNDSLPDGAGDYFYPDGSVYLGTWEGGVREGFGMFVGAGSPALVGTWQGDKFQGERLLYTEHRVYGIDIARYQHLN